MTDQRAARPAVIEPLESRTLFSADPVVADAATGAVTSASTVAVADVPIDAADVTGPTILRVQVIGSPFAATGIRVTFSEPLAVGPAQRLENYVVLGQTLDDPADFNPAAHDLRGGGYFTDVDAWAVRRRVFPDDATYDPADNSVTLTAAAPFDVRYMLRNLWVRSGPDGVRDVAGNRLDGDEDGRPGGLADVAFRAKLAKNLKYIDDNGDKVRLRLRGGGRLLVLQRANPNAAVDRQAVQVWLTGKVRPTSVLSGEVTPTRRGGDGLTFVRQIVGATPARLDVLADPRFTVGEVLP